MSFQSFVERITGDPGPSTASHREWEAALASFDDSTATHEYTAWPSLYNLLGVEVKHDVKEVTLAVQETPEMSRQPSSDITRLLARLHSHVHPASNFTALIDLLASPGDDDSIQSELVEILGFEGDGLALVEQVLRPGVRRGLVEAERQGKKPKPKARKGKIDITDLVGTPEDIERRIQEQLHRPKAMFAEEGQQRVAVQQVEQLPYVFTSAAPAMSYGGKFTLPHGTEREQTDQWEEVIVPPPNTIPPKASERPVMISQLPPLARGCFPGYSRLNRMQSVVQPIAMGTNENMLVCAPTGAGKTDVAIMSILRVLQMHVKDSKHPSGFNIDRDAFKIIYVAPMKALAAEITRKFGKRLAWLGIKVRELTGDMQLTRQEIAETQVIVTTPEKWDVVTRKPTGEGELASKVRLLIIDEVHLLNEERGAVIETIVARTLRMVESSQSVIRIVGLSATLPNYIDVSDFLRVNRYQGLFFFDASFRPVPLEQHFIGVKGKARSFTQQRNMDQAVFDKVIENVREGHQVMVFVHARKETVKTAQRLREMAMEEGVLELFDTRDHVKFQLYRRDIGTSRNKEMRELFDSGFGIHHAGMLRSDRNMMERMFEDQAIKVLCCTSTLAWGVNLPAHAVVIKGTNVYDSGRGAFVDLSVLDVLQIFGRAGRPGYETSGVGYICTSQDKLDHYLQQIMSQQPIESKFIPGMVDALNAEISLGTISNVPEAISWIGYTYLFVRMRREPFIYGMSHDEPKDDPQLGTKRSQLVTTAAKELSDAKMIRFDEHTKSFAITDLGRIAARYYLRHQTVEVFNKEFNPKMKNADIFGMLSQATEFEQIQVRDTEVDELTNIMNSDNCPMEVKGGATNKHGKVNILLQGYISKVYIEDFALVSDSAYVAQNAGRIIRALLEIALSRNWANCALLLIDLSKAIERRMWPYDHPLQQLATLQKDTLYNLRRWADDTEISELREMDPKDIGQLIHMNETHGKAIHAAAVQFPSIGVSYALRPLAHDLLQITVTVKREFEWSAKLSTSAEPFYVWAQDAEGLNILQWRSILVRQSSSTLDIDFVIPWTGEHSSISIVTASDRWLGSDSQTHVSLENLVMPAPFTDATPVLDLPFLPISAVDDAVLANAYRPVTLLNGLQSQVFWTLFHTNHNVLISAPVASGKSLLGEMALWHAFKHNKSTLAIVVVPHAHAANETAARIRSITQGGDIAVTSVKSSDALLKASRGAKGRVIVAIPEAFQDIAGETLSNLVGQTSIAVFEDLHLLDAEYELVVAKLMTMLQPARVRVVGITNSLNDPSDLAAWLAVSEANSFCFYPRDRGAPVIVQLKTFSTPHSATLLKTMVKPAYDIVKAATGSVVIFVPSRGACRSVASDLVTQSGVEFDLNGFLNAPREDVEPLVANVRDSALLEPLLHGIGYVLPHMAPSDLALVLELFAAGIVRALIAPREAAWSLPVRGNTVVLMGAQYRLNESAANYSPNELVKMQGFAVQSAHPASPSGRMHILCQGEQVTAISRVLSDGLSLESSLLPVLRRKHEDKDDKGVDRARTTLDKMLKPRDAPAPLAHNRPQKPDLRKRDLMDVLGWTYLLSRVQSNPTFYDSYDGAEMLSRAVDEWFRPLDVKAGQERKEAKRVAKEEEERKDAEEEGKSAESKDKGEIHPTVPQVPQTNGDTEFDIIEV